MNNGRQRARQIADLVSDVQHYLARNRETPEAGDLRRAVAALEDARRRALTSSPGEEDES